MTNHHDITDKFIEFGVFQMGYFQRDDTFTGYQLDLSMLPSYPAFMLQIALLLQHKIEGYTSFKSNHKERLVSLDAMLPLASLVSANTQIPLIYSRGRGEAPVFDFVGAYDVGHPAIILTSELNPNLIHTLKDMRSVGLIPRRIMPLLGFEFKFDGLSIDPVFIWDIFLEELIQHQKAPQAQVHKIIEQTKSNFDALQSLIIKAQ